MEIFQLPTVHGSISMFNPRKFKYGFIFRQLHGTCGILLSVGAIGDSVHQFSHFYMLYLMFSGTTFTFLQTCVIVNTIPIIGLNFGLIMSFFIAFDRFFSVVFPGK